MPCPLTDTAATPYRRTAGSLSPGCQGRVPRCGGESLAPGRSVHTGDTDAHLREGRSLRFPFDTHHEGRVQQLPAPGSPDRGRRLDLLHVRSGLPSRGVCRTPGHPATHCRRADGEKRGSNRPHARSRHRPRLERTTRRRDALGPAHETQANAAEIDAVLAATGDRQIVEVSARDPWWRARPVADRYEGRNVLGRLWMELRQQLPESDQAARSGAWSGRVRVGCLVGGTDVPRVPREAA